MAIQAMYKSWVELESSVIRAHDDLRAILANRERAAILRREAEQVLLEGEAVREEARRIGESAWLAFDRGFAVNPRALASQSARLKEVEDAMKTQAALQRASHRETWDESDKTRQKATADLLKVLMALRTAVVQVEREVHEAANLPAVADSLRDSAREELRGAEAIRNELAFLGQEALYLLGAEPSKGERPPDSLPESQPQRPSLGREERQAAFSPGPFETPSLEGRTPAHPAQDPQEFLPTAAEGIEAATSVAWEPVEAQPAREETLDDDTASRPQLIIEHDEPEEDILPGTPIQTLQQPVMPPISPSQPEPPRVIEMPSENPAASVAEELRREMESISLSGPAAQDLPHAVTDAPDEEFDVPAPAGETAESLPGGATQELIRELEALRKPPEPLGGLAPSAAQELTDELANSTRFVDAAPQEAPTSIEFEPLGPVVDQDQETPVSGEPPGQAPAEAAGHPGAAALEESPTPSPAGLHDQSYTGRIFLMFSASLSQDSLESVWDFLEEVAGPGSIADMRLISQDAGVQFTLELGAKVLGLDEMRRQAPKAEFVPLADDRLMVNWQG